MNIIQAFEFFIANIKNTFPLKANFIFETNYREITKAQILSNDFVVQITSNHCHIWCHIQHPEPSNASKTIEHWRYETVEDLFYGLLFEHVYKVMNENTFYEFWESDQFQKLQQLVAKRVAKTEDAITNLRQKWIKSEWHTNDYLIFSENEIKASNIDLFEPLFKYHKDSFLLVYSYSIVKQDKQRIMLQIYSSENMAKVVNMYAYFHANFRYMWLENFPSHTGRSSVVTLFKRDFVGSKSFSL